MAIITLQRDAKGKIQARVTLDKLSERKGSISPHAMGLNILRQAQEELGPALNAVLTHAAHDIPHDINKPSLLGQLVCQAILEKSNAQVAIVNDGGIHSHVEMGPVTAKKLYEILPYENKIIRMDISGAELRTLMEFALGDHMEKGIQVGGMKVVCDPSLPSGKRVLSMTLQDGNIIDDKSTISLAVNNYLAQGGDGFPMQTMGYYKEVLKLSMRDMVSQWLQERKSVSLPLNPWVESH